MPSTHIRKRVRARPHQVFDMVSDVESYPEFINLISSLRVTKKISKTDFEAQAIVAYKMIRESFNSHIHADRDSLFIHVKKAEKGGALKTLDNKWYFYELSDGSTGVDFYVDVSLKIFPLNMLVQDKMGRASELIMDAFMRRAEQVCSLMGYPTLTEELQAELEAKTMV